MTEVLFIGAGPSGAMAAAQLRQSGHDMLVLEKQRFWLPSIRLKALLSVDAPDAMRTTMEGHMWNTTLSCHDAL